MIDALVYKWSSVAGLSDTERVRGAVEELAGELGKAVDKAVGHHSTECSCDQCVFAEWINEIIGRDGSSTSPSPSLLNDTQDPPGVFDAIEVQHGKQARRQVEAAAYAALIRSNQTQLEKIKDLVDLSLDDRLAKLEEDVAIYALRGRARWEAIDTRVAKLEPQGHPYTFDLSGDMGKGCTRCGGPTNAVHPLHRPGCANLITVGMKPGGGCSCPAAQLAPAPVETLPLGHPFVGRGGDLDVTGCWHWDRDTGKHCSRPPADHEPRAAKEDRQEPPRPCGCAPGDCVEGPLAVGVQCRLTKYVGASTTPGTGGGT